MTTQQEEENWKRMKPTTQVHKTVGERGLRRSQDVRRQRMTQDHKTTGGRR